MEGVVVGRIVHFVLREEQLSSDVPAHMVIRPAIVVRVWNAETGSVNLQVFTDGSNDGAAYASGLSWQTSVLYSEEWKVGTWHWPERV